MIRKLRTKLIGISMLSLLLVLTILIATINILNYRSIVARADETLALLAENDGRFPLQDFQNFQDFTPLEPDNPETPSVPQDPDEPETPSEPGDIPEIKEPGENFSSLPDAESDPRTFSPELPFESRYYYVLFSEIGEVLNANTDQIAAIDADTAIEYAKKVYEDGDSHGFIQNYRFLRHEQSGQTRIIFLDSTRDLSTFRTFLLASCGISLLGLLAVFVLIAIFSRRIVKPLIESYEKQKQFITNAGHEIKTPITIIDADAEVLEMDLGDDNEWLKDIRSQASRLATLTNDLIFLSRMEEDQVPLTLIEFPISDVVLETAQSFQARALTQNLSLSIQVQPMLSYNGDEKSIRQLVSILMDNALKYTTTDGSITVTFRPHGHYLLLEIINSSAPLSAEQLSHLFDRFYRSDASHNSQTGGYGIGLSIARAIVTSHKGRIGADIPEEGVLRITVALPI